MQLEIFTRLITTEIQISDNTLPLESEKLVHTRENSWANEVILNGQKTRLSYNCVVIFNALMRGERLTGQSIVKKYGMLEYRRRIKDLKDAGVPIEEKVLSNGCKEWFI